MNRWGFPDLGLGIGLRPVHFDAVLEDGPAPDWFEVLSENFLDTGGRPRAVLEEVAARWPVVLHGVSMSIGSTDPLDYGYLDKLKELARWTKARWISDHLCWTGVAGRNGHDLYPVPYTAESLAWIVERVQRVQDALGRPILLENPSTYLSFGVSTMPEAEFLAALCERADCGLLLDVNNVYVSCRNHGWSVADWFARIPWDRVVQIHLAGHRDKGTHCIDTHDGPVIDEVWKLYGDALGHCGPVSTMIEWDAEIPPLDVVVAEVHKARRWRDDVVGLACRDEAGDDDQ